MRSWRLCSCFLNICALWLLSCSGESATRNYWVPTSKSFNRYSFVVGWSWYYIWSELTLFCTYWSDILREGNTDARFITNCLQSGVVVKRTRCWIMSDVFFTIISNWKFRSISFVRTWAILSKLSVTIIFFRSRYFRCVTQERLPSLFANGSIWILLQIPNMINIISSRSIIKWIRKDWRSISLKFNRYWLVSSANRSRNLVLLRPRAHSLIYFSIYVAIPLLSLTNMVLWATWELWIEIILSWSWSSRLRHRKSGIYCLLYVYCSLSSTSWSGSISTFQSPSSVTPCWK